MARAQKINEENGPEVEETAAPIETTPATPAFTEEELGGIVRSRTLSGLFNGASLGGGIGLFFGVLGVLGGAEPTLMQFLSVMAVPAGIGGFLGGLGGAASGYSRVRDLREQDVNRRLQAGNDQGAPRIEP